MGDELFEALTEFAESEVNFHVQLVVNGSTADNVSSPPIANALNAIESNPINVRPGQSMTIRQAIDSFGDAKVRQVELALLDGHSDTQQQLSKRIRKLIPLNKNQAGTLARTSQNAASTMAAYKTFAANLDILDGYRWVSTLDSRTSFICMARDGEIYRFSAANPIPPAHWGCRSVIVPVIDKKYDIGATIDNDRPAVGSGGVEQVTTRTTYLGWLKRQSKDFIDEKLGPVRSQLYREGKLTIDKFSDSSGRVYTLRQLEALYPVVFARQ